MDGNLRTIFANSTLSVQSTSTLTGLQNNGSFITTTTGSIGTTFTVAGAMNALSTLSVGSTFTANGAARALSTLSVGGITSCNGFSLSSGSFTVGSKVIDVTAGDAVTINSTAGRFRKDNSGSVFTLTNSFITANSVIVLTSSTTGITTGYHLACVAGAGSAVITFETAGVAAAPNTNYDVNFIIMN
jgi:hypothetical protein